MLNERRVERFICIPAGGESWQRFGFPSRACSKKVDPYLRLLYDALHIAAGSRPHPQGAEGV